MPNPKLHGSIMDALAENPRVPVDEIAVEVNGGDAVLRGTVGSLLEQAEAVRAARMTDGVRTVDNQLRVRPSARLSGRADADTEAAVLDALATDPSIDVADIDVEVRAGAVTLRGCVDWPEQRADVARIARAVPGVGRVDDKLTVSADRAQEPAEDRDIFGAEEVAARL